MLYTEFGILNCRNLVHSRYLSDLLEGIPFQPRTFIRDKVLVLKLYTVIEDAELRCLSKKSRAYLTFIAYS